MKIIFNVTVVLLIGFAMVGCKKYGDDYKQYLDNKELTYPGLAQNVSAQSGNLRAVLHWNPSPDPSITKYVISWNNGANSTTVEATSHDPKEVLTVSIPNLSEFVYSFKIVAYDNEGRVSVGQELNNVRVYGSAYRASIINRAYNRSEPYIIYGDGRIQLNFNKADTTNLSTLIRYTNINGEIEEKELPRDESSITLSNYKRSTQIQFRSSYKPEVTAIDTFNVSTFVNLFDNLPALPVVAVECDKSLFRSSGSSPITLPLPTDIRSEYGWEIRYLWDNNYGEPGFHTPGTSMPQWFTFDMGASAALVDFRVWQRESSLYDAGNPKRFEIWGSNNPNSDGSWDSWTKLGTCTSVKPSGQSSGYTPADKTYALAGEKFAFPAVTTPVRYIRIKVLETWGGSNYFHLIELTFNKKN